MYIAYLWVDSWLKLMSACAEQMQMLPVAIEGNGAAAVDRNNVHTAFGARLEALEAEHADELEQLRAAHGAEVALLRGGLADAETAYQASGQQNAALQAEMQRWQQQGESDRADLTQRLAAEGAARAKIAEELDELRRQLVAARAESASVRAEVETSRTEALLLRTRADEVAGETAAAAAHAGEEIKALRRQLAAATAENQEARRENRKLTADHEALVRTSERMAADLNSLKARLDDALAMAAAAPPAPAAAPPVAGNAPPARKPGKSAVVTTAHPAPAVAAAAAEALTVSAPVGQTFVMEKPPVPVGEAPQAPVIEAPQALVQAAPETAGAAAPAGLDVRFRKPSGWSEPLYVHYWATDPAVAEPVWPGRPMTDAGDGWWAFHIDGARAAHLLFSDNAGHQTGDLHRDRSGGLDHDGSWVDDRP